MAKDKFINLIGSSENRLNSVFRFLLENQKCLNDCLFNEAQGIVNIHCEMLYEIIYKTYQSNPLSFISSLRKDLSETNDLDLYDNCAKIIEHILSFFPKVSSKLVNRTSPILNVLIFLTINFFLLFFYTIFFILIKSKS